MKWQSDGLHERHPPWIDNNSTVYSAVGQVLLVMKTPEGPRRTLEYRSLFKFSVNVSALQHLVGNESSCLQGENQKKLENASSLCLISDPQCLLKRLSDLIACQTGCIYRPLMFHRDSSGHAVEQSSGLCWARRGSQVATEVTIWTTSPFSPWMAPWMASFTSMSACRAGASSAAWNTWKRGGGDEWEEGEILHAKHSLIMQHPASANKCHFENAATRVKCISCQVTDGDQAIL